MERAGMPPDPWQRRLLRSRAERVLLLCSRQSGKSTVTAAMALHEVLFRPKSLVLLLSPSLRQSQELFRKVTDFRNRLGEPVPVAEESALRVELQNGSRIVALPGTEETVRGFSGVRLLVVDEAARVDDPLYFSIRPMLAVSGGRMVCLTTPFGKTGILLRGVDGRRPVGPHQGHGEGVPEDLGEVPRGRDGPHSASGGTSRSTSAPSRTRQTSSSGRSTSSGRSRTRSRRSSRTRRRHNRCPFRPATSSSTTSSRSRSPSSEIRRRRRPRPDRGLHRHHDPRGEGEELLRRPVPRAPPEHAVPGDRQAARPPREEAPRAGPRWPSTRQESAVPSST